MRITLFFSICLFAFSGCNSGPEKIAPIDGTNPTNQSQTGIFQKSAPSAPTSSNNSVSSGHHHVIVNELLETEKYTYLKVSEQNREYWVATIKGSFEIGKEYVYNGGLLKTNFKSIEHDRIFEELYLLTALTPASEDEHAPQPKAEAPKKTVKSSGVKPNNTTSIAEIVKNPEQFTNQKLLVYGEVVKVNPNIMGTNWHHLQDGSANDYDFVITSETSVPVGHKIAFEGVVSTNKDFGAGYKYEIIMENAIPLN